MATTDLSTDPLDVTVGSADTLSVDFTDHMASNGLIQSSTAVLVRTNATAGDSTVAGFVISASVSGKTVLVRWTGSVLAAGQTHLLKTAAVLGTGATVVVLTEVRCVA